VMTLCGSNRDADSRDEIPCGDVMNGKDLRRKEIGPPLVESATEM
jgi:hypothetical protein